MATASFRLLLVSASFHGPAHEARARLAAVSAEREAAERAREKEAAEAAEAARLAEALVRHHHRTPDKHIQTHTHTCATVMDTSAVSDCH